MADQRSDTVVVDAGARYGMHPSWRGFEAELAYFAFEPDSTEVTRLREQPQPPGVELVEAALTDAEGLRDLRIATHGGCSSFLEVDPSSEWFGRYRPGDGALRKVASVTTRTVDAFATERGLAVDFMKIDTEGTELEVLQGAERELCRNILGLRINVSFQRSYVGQALFSDIHAYLIDRRFFLLNLDYFGRGVPRNALFRNPDPMSLDVERYGTLIGTDAVWLLEQGAMVDRWRGDAATLALASLRYAAFCFLNHGPDVAVDTLVRQIEHAGAFPPAVTETLLFRFVRRRCAEFLGRWRVFPDSQWRMCQELFDRIFGLRLEGGHAYWELMQRL